MASLYFASYALIATIGGLFVGWAQFSRKKREGAPLNMTVLKALSGMAIAMWIGAGLTALAYKDGDTLETWVLIASVVGAVAVAFFSWQMIQVSRQMDADRKALRDLATRDALTNSWNRRIFQENLQSEIGRAKSTGQPLTLLMFDIDDFHAVNLRHGYKIGDGILRELVHRIFEFMGGSYSVYRYGGEEIALILPGHDDRAAERIADDMTKAITGRPYDVGEHGPVSIAVSIGVAAYSDAVGSEERLIENAIAALKISRTHPGDKVTVAGRDF